MKSLQYVIIAVASSVFVETIIVFIYSKFRRRTLNQRIVSISSRLGFQSDKESKNIEISLAELESAVDKVSILIADSSADSLRLRKAFDCLPAGIIILDERLDEVFRNAAVVEITKDLAIEAFVGKLINEIKLERFENSELFEAFGPPKKIFEARLFRIINASRLIGSLIYIEDITEKKLLEEVRRDFVANVSHELKTPMAALGILAETISQENDIELIKPLVARIQTEAFRAGKIIDDLLDLSRIEVGGTALFEPVDLSLVMAEAVERVRYLAEKKDVKLSFEEPGEIKVMGNRRDLVSVFYNLLDNAIKYSESGKEVRFYTELHDDKIVINVSDKGIGIPAKDLSRIFERFYRVDPGRSRESGGTGLGLAIVKHVVQNHSGQVSVSSREGEGSCFTITFPVFKGNMLVNKDNDVTY